MMITVWFDECTINYQLKEYVPRWGILKLREREREESSLFGKESDSILLSR